MKTVATLGIVCSLLLCAPYAAVAGKLNGQCVYKGISLKGKVKQVQHNGDIKVKIVKSFSDLKVQRVKSFPDACGKWQFVDSFPDFTVQFVDSFEDIKIQYVNSFPGIK